MSPHPTTSATATDEHPLQDQIAALVAALRQILRDHPAGLSEHTLIKTLQSPAWDILEPTDFRDPAKLYPVHFLIFHALYRLREALLSTGHETVKISALHIVIQPLCQPSGKTESDLPDRHDALADFYLNLENLRLERAVIDEMLDDFWKGIRRTSPEELKEACTTLKLDCPPPDLESANRQFRRLAMEHHPDRGGERHKLQSANSAIAVVRSYFRQTGT